MAIWLATVGVLGLLLFLANCARSPLDDPDAARQRPGLLDAVGRPTPAPRVDGLPVPGHRAVVFFVRPILEGPLCDALAHDASLRGHADLAVASSGGSFTCADLIAVDDSAGTLAREFGMRRPRDGGPPVGYAVVDSSGRVRYRTLDPSVVDGIDEVETIVRATP